MGAYGASLAPLRVLRRQRRARPHRHGRADHGPRPDRAAGHHRHRSGPAGARHRQSAASEPPSSASAATRRGRSPAPSTRPCRAPRPIADWVQGHFIHHRDGVLPRHPQPLRSDSANEEEAARGAGHEPPRRRAERPAVGAMADHARRARQLREEEGVEQHHRPQRDPHASGARRRGWTRKACRSTATGRSATTACSPRPSTRCRSPAGARRPATTSRSSGWSIRRA